MLIPLALYLDKKDHLFIYLVYSSAIISEVAAPVPSEPEACSFSGLLFFF